MLSRRISTGLVGCCFVLLAMMVFSTGFAEGIYSDKAIVADGHVFHDAGNVWNNVTNWGMIGSAPSINAPGSSAPSARWSGEFGDDYLWAAGLWVGGVVQGEHLVSVGSFSSEFLPTDAPGDTIYATARGADGGNRFPFKHPDDDGDGMEDEELLNGLDDDGDGLVDEDYAAIGDQHYVCGYNDFQLLTMENHPDHTPLNISVIQQSIQWSSALAGDFIGYDFTITNEGENEIENVYLGMFSDFDIGSSEPNSGAADDYAGFVSTVVQAEDGSEVLVQVAYMYDGATSGALDGYAGWVLCGHTTDLAGLAAPAEVGVFSYNSFSGSAPYAQGGDPTNDSERYDSMQSSGYDADVPANRQGDYRTLISSGPFAGLASGESISYQVALVMGASLDDLIANAAEAVDTYRGVDYDRDCDPSNGDEFTVHWLRSEDAPAVGFRPRVRAHMRARVHGNEVALQINGNMRSHHGLMVIRRQSESVTERLWEGSELLAGGHAGHKRMFRLVDTDLNGWPRQYDLVLATGGQEILLDQIVVQRASRARAQLTASPNPFNPRVEISYVIEETSHVRLQIYDLRGHVVRTLLDRELPVGESSVFWNGDDNASLAVGSGVYVVRLETGGQLTEKRVTLVR